MSYIRCALLIAAAAAGPLLPLSVQFRSFDHAGYSRMVFEADRPFTYRVQEKPGLLEVALPEAVDSWNGSGAVSRLLAQVSHELREGRSVFTLQFRDGASIRKSFVLENPFRVVFDLTAAPRPADTAAPQAAALPQAATPAPVPAQPAAEPARAKPIETICIDAGHGGDDFGAVSRSRLQEKNVTLAVARRLKKLVESRLGLRVIMTRDKDAEVSLNTRASIANNQQAQLFISIHVNSSFRKTARGSETYFVSLNATDPEALELARKENQNGEDIGEAIKSDELKMILWNMAQAEYIRESSRLAEYVQNELNELLDTRNRGVKQAPFRVLMRAAMPAVLVEVAFISNPSEEKKLAQDDFLEKVALAVYNGVAKFIAFTRSALQ